ncbi:MAG: phosphohydrolase [Candidatus Taylorbacteria bacterium RIFCSPHIGHO2_01_FULL_46_22b]|uniref:Phosphohydrolase n=1 Tax=Candidatus Taylorbacteria bacterium RIFCSPHIGHO2_01_FULL_46_22b TaxID=1802301 RepID=A0A1G2M3Y7_9BACT|nr:MAG: phosphohydrolase [Candidatus Taylorbacteria bacterium RIFCSPHIGHO2_01_FULL_46_22b]
MNEQNLIAVIADEVKGKLGGEGSGHDWWHIYRVWKMAQHIGREEKADMFVVELAALLHDIADWKFHGGDDTVGPRVAGEMLVAHKVAPEIIERVQKIISEISFKGAGVKTEASTLEGKVVQDADRLDAIGAIGIARAFAYGGHKGRLLYDPAVKPSMHRTKESYSKSENPTINHFYEKLLLLKDRLNTKSAQAIASRRHEFMEEYLDRFYKEWDGIL